jgi:hypothetical protein
MISNISKPLQTIGRPRRPRTPITHHLSLITCAALLACAGCGTIYPGTIYPVTDESNYLTYDHPFTDAAAQMVLQNAGKICAERKQNAIKTSSACSLTRCTTHYQCVPKDGSTGY